MKKSRKILISAIFILIVLICIGCIYIFSNKDNTNTTDYSQELDKQEDIVVEENSQTEESFFNSLKDDLGNGKAGDAISVVEDIDDQGNRTYTYNFENGDSRTITIRRDDSNEDQGYGDSGEDSKDIEDNPVVDEPEDTPGTVFEKFLKMSSYEQYQFYLSFENSDDYYKWYREAEAEYNALHPMIEVGEDEVIDFSN